MGHGKMVFGAAGRKKQQEIRLRTGCAAGERETQKHCTFAGLILKWLSVERKNAWNSGMHVYRKGCCALFRKASDGGKMKFETILFDLDGVILDFEKAEALSFRNTFSAYGIAPEEEVFALYQTINRARWEALERGEIGYRDCTVGRFEELFARLGKQVDCGSFSRDYLLGIGDGAFLMPGAREVLEALHGRCRIYAVTNGVGMTQRKRLAGTDTLRYFDGLFISEEMGVQKPDSAYFARVMEEIPGFDRKKTLLVGDTLSSDILGAVQAGIPSCWVNPGGKKNRTALRPDYEICALPELLEILRGAEA